MLKYIQKSKTKIHQNSVQYFSSEFLFSTEGSIVADVEIYLSEGHKFWKWISTIMC